MKTSQSPDNISRINPYYFSVRETLAYDLQRLIIFWRAEYRNYHRTIGNIKINEKYFYIDRFKNQDFRIHNTLIDTAQYNSFNYFKNKKECEEFARFEYLNLKLIRLRNELNNGWKPDWSNSNRELKHFIELECNEINFDNSYFFKFSNLYFKTEELREEFLKLIPNEEIIEYLNF